MSIITPGGIFGLDYNEGRWTPEIADASSGGNVASPVQDNGWFTKIGRNVTISVDITNINTSGLTGSNFVFLRDLPYIPASLSGGTFVATAPCLGGGTWASATTVMAVVTDNQNYLRFISADSTLSNWLTVADVTSGATDIRFSLTYFTAR
jgi:hypothetical protein